MAVIATHNETSTGVTSDIAAVRAGMDAAGSDALLFVDGVSSIASIDFQQEAWGVDLAVTGSQKGLMLPPGLAVLGVSAKALAAAQTSTMARSYFSFEDMIRPTIPATSPTPRPFRCCTAWPPRSICCSPRACRTSSPATSAWPRASAEASTHSGCHCARRPRSCIPTPSPRSSHRRESTETTSVTSPTSAIARRSEQA